LSSLITSGIDPGRAHYPLLAVSPPALLTSRKLEDPFPPASYRGYGIPDTISVRLPVFGGPFTLVTFFPHVGARSVSSHPGTDAGPDSFSSLSAVGRGNQEAVRHETLQPHQVPRCLTARGGSGVPLRTSKKAPGQGQTPKPAPEQASTAGAATPSQEASAPPSHNDGRPRFCPFCAARVRWRLRYYAEIGDRFWEMACGACGMSLQIDAEVMVDAGQPDPELPDDGEEVEST
jgi:hypothetical protein